MLTTKQRSRFLLGALLLSLILHLAGGRFIHWPHVQRDEFVERVSLTKRLLLHARSHVNAPRRVPRKIAGRTVAPPHKPAPPPQAPIGKPNATGAKASPSPTQTSGGALQTASPPPAAPATAVPSVSPRVVAGCAAPNRPAAIVEKAVPAISKTAREAGTHGIARVRVTVSADATVADTTLTDSSQNRELDLEALGAARASTYSPATANCKPVTGQTEYAVEFVPF